MGRLVRWNACRLLPNRPVYLAADVDDLLARIRAAVEAERDWSDQVAEYLADTGNVGLPSYTCHKRDQQRAALDELLGGSDG